MRTTTSTPPSMDRLLGVVPSPHPGAGAPRPAWLGADAPDGDAPDGDGSGADRPDGGGPEWEGRAPAPSRHDADRRQDHDAPAGGEYRAPAGDRFVGRVPERWRGARVALGRRGAVALAGVGLLAAVAAGIGVLHDRPASVRVPQVPTDPVPIGEAADGDAGDAGTAAVGATPGPDGTAGLAGAGGPGGERAAAAPEEIVVSVQGLVDHSGLFRLDRGARVADALDAAGGPTDGADLLSLNLAQRLSDGDQILVGMVPEDAGAPRLRSATVSAGGAGTAAPDPDAGTGGGGSSAGDAGAAVDLNTADQAELETLPGVGPVTAEAILQWRRQNGRFTSVDQLTEVRGIGPATLEELRDAVTV